MKTKTRKQKSYFHSLFSAIFFPYSIRKIALFGSLLVLAFSFNACKKVIENLKKETKGMGENLVNGMTDQLATDSTKLRIDNFIGNLTRTLTDSLNKDRLARIGVDTLSEIVGGKIMEGVGKGLDDALLKAKVDSFLNNVSRNGKVAIDKMFDGLTSTESKEKLTQLISSALRESLDDRLNLRLRTLSTGLLDSVITDLRLEQIKSQLVGQTMGDSLNARLDSAFSIIINRINKDLEPIVEEDELSFLKKWGNQLLIFAGLITLGLIAFFWYQKNKSNRVTQLLMTQINEMPNQNAYDDLTYRIQEVARRQNVESIIRGILKENGMLGEESWKIKQQKIKNSG